MKKFLVCFAVFAAMVLMVSCGGGSSKTGDATDTGESVSDEDRADSGSTENPDSENPDSDNPDTAPDDGDSAPDNDTDSTDSAPDSDPSEPANENPDNLPECSPTSTTPCIDSATGLIWSGKSPEMVSWTDAGDYCENLKEGGYSDWRLPSVAVLRTLYNSNLECSKFGEIVFFWSSSKGQGLSFYDGTAQSRNINETFDARCVRKEIKTRKADCTGLPEHAEWNTVSEITQTWNWETAGWSSPSLNGSYNEEPSTTKCRYKCAENYLWWEYYSTCVDINDSNIFFSSDCVAKIENLENLTQEQLEAKKDKWHEGLQNACPYNYIRQPEIYDETTGCVYVVDKCEGNLEGPMWIENVAPKVIFDLLGAPPPYYHGITSMTFNYSSNGSQSNMKIRVPNLIMDVNFVSQSCLSQVDENTSVINMALSVYPDRGCYIDGENQTPPIETKSAKQTRSMSEKYRSLCKSMPNYKLDEYHNACYVTIDDFVWLENVVNKYIVKLFKSWRNDDTAVKSIKRDLDTGVFSMEIQVGYYTDLGVKMYITLNNAKSCIDQCHGKEGCTSHIEPIGQDPSKGCFINGTEVNGEE